MLDKLRSLLSAHMGVHSEVLFIVSQSLYVVLFIIRK